MVFHVAKNYLRDDRKSARLKRTVQLDGTVTEDGGPVDPQDNPEGRALDAERTHRLNAAIQKLPEQQREVMLLRASGYTISEA